MDGYIADIVTSFIEIPGQISTCIYFTGCPFDCEGCHNQTLKNKLNGKLVTIEYILKCINDNTLAKWVCFIGGEPFYQPQLLYNLCSRITKPIGIYTGNNYSTLLLQYSEIIQLSNVKFLKTGKYISQLTNELEYPITTNQKVHLKYNNNWIEIFERTTQVISDKINLLDNK